MNGPKTLLVEPTNRCNANCLICGRRWWDRPLGDMPLAAYKRLIDQLPDVEAVQPTQYGEPLLHPDIVEMVAYAHDAGCHTWITTNGQLLTEDMSDRLIDAGLDKVIISIDAMYETEFARLRPGLSLDVIKENMGNIEVARLEVVVSTVGVDGSTMAHWIYDMGLLVEGVATSNEVDTSPCPGAASGKPIDCNRPHETMVVRWDGEVVLCCRDCHCHWSFGNVNDTHPLEIWHSARFEAVREAMRTGVDYPAMCVGCRGFDPERRPPRRG